MNFTTTASVAADGMLHIPVPEGAVGAKYDVTLVRRLTPEELGWPPGYFEKTFGSITDPAFKVYPHLPPCDIRSLDAEGE